MLSFLLGDVFKQVSSLGESKFIATWYCLGDKGYHNGDREKWHPESIFAVRTGGRGGFGQMDPKVLWVQESNLLKLMI